MKGYLLFACAFAGVIMTSCRKADTPSEQPASTEELLNLEDVAKMLSAVGIGQEQMEEVHDAALSSEGNGYDEEYTMQDLFSNPGSGVGCSRLTTKAQDEVKTYTSPLKDLITKYYKNGTKSEVISAEEYLEYISSSDMQIYWPFAEKWDGKTMPIITFDPTGSASSNFGYRLGADGEVEEVLVTEELAASTPVWVVNRNDDASYETLEILRKNHPEWGSGGSVVVRTKSVDEEDSGCQTLILQDFKALRNYDSFFAGGSEFFIKIGAVESFTASTEAEMYLYNPEVTDFMVKMKRSEVGETKTINTLLMSEWTEQLDNIAFMIIEDDGGTQTSWKCSAQVKLKSKSYGFEVELPYHSRDDIVWRGQMSRKYIESKSSVAGCFGDVLLTFAVK